MPIIMAIATIVGVAYFLMVRARQARELSDELRDVAQTVSNMPRKMRFQRQANTHPVDVLEDPKQAATAMALAFQQLSGLPKHEDHERLRNALQTEFSMNKSEAEEALVFGNWLITQCNGPSPAITRLSRKLARFGKQEWFEPSLSLIKSSLESGDLTQTQREALDDIRRGFGIR